MFSFWRLHRSAAMKFLQFLLLASASQSHLARENALVRKNTIYIPSYAWINCLPQFTSQTLFGTPSFV